ANRPMTHEIRSGRSASFTFDWIGARCSEVQKFNERLDGSIAELIGFTNVLNQRLRNKIKRSLVARYVKN
ncbi:MAG: hypothetical protein ABEN55_11505, partial [Bradymonadaceae bacterium]